MHFYTKTENGVEPRHFVKQKKDPSKSRASRVTDAKSAAKTGERWFPSVTGILGVLDKPGLNNWKVDQHLQTAWEFHLDSSNRDKPMTYDDFLAIVKSGTRERLDSAPKAGTDMHDVLERYIRDGVEPDGIEFDICYAVKNKLNEVCGEQDWRCEEYFVDTAMGYAGCADLVSDEWIIDYKTKQEANKFKPGKMAYPEHRRQLAAYDAGISPTGRRCANIFICLETGEIDFHQHKEKDLMNGWLDFQDCLNIYHRNTYNPLEG